MNRKYLLVTLIPLMLILSTLVLDVSASTVFAGKPEKSGKPDKPDTETHTQFTIILDGNIAGTVKGVGSITGKGLHVRANSYHVPEEYSLTLSGMESYTGGIGVDFELSVNFRKGEASLTFWWGDNKKLVIEPQSYSEEYVLDDIVKYTLKGVKALIYVGKGKNVVPDPFIITFSFTVSEGW